jgi:F-type H+-transporting ATPase subunit b
MVIDAWTLVLQTINVLILIWLLQKFFWRPVSAIIAERRGAAAKLLADAAQKLTESETDLAEISRIRAGFTQEREAILATAQADAAKLKDMAERDAAASAQALETAAQSRIADEQRKAEATSRAAAISLALDIATRLAARLEGRAVRAAFLDWLLREIAALPESLRPSGEKLELTSAEPLQDAEARELTQRIALAFGGQPDIAVAADPRLIAGLELKSKHLWLQNSWRADLGRIRERLEHDASV